MVRQLYFCLGIVVCVVDPVLAQVGPAAVAPESIAPGEEVPRLVGPVIALPGSEPSRAEASLQTNYPLLRLPTDHVTVYGSRRFGPLYEPTRKPPPTDPVTGWPVHGIGAPVYWTSGPAFRSFHRPWFVPYGYGYGWGYRYPFGFRSSLYSPGFHRPWYADNLYRPWFTHPAPYWSHLYNGIYDSEHAGASVFDDVIVADSPHAGCFFW